MFENEYNDFFAECYDILHSNLEDVEAFKEMAERFGPKVLELGVGTGRIAIPLARESYHVTGLDISENMLTTCREKLDEERENTVESIDLVKGDVRNFHLAGKFDLILASCNIMNYLVEISELKKALSCIKKHLTHDGAFVIDNSLPDVQEMVERNGEEFRYEYENPNNGRKIIDRFTPTYDFVDQIEHDTIHFTEYDGEEKTREIEIEETLTFYFPRELREILTNERYEIFEERGSLNNNEPIDQDSEEMIFLCKRSD